jgi:Domain of unknown function (DUF4917)
MEPTPITYSGALADTAGAPRNLLLGNGFSIAVHDAFGYPALFKSAVRRDPSLANLFPHPERPNFEEALLAARNDAETSARIRSSLIRAVAEAHPYRALSIREEKRRSSRDFLSDYVGRNLTQPGSVFTTNYDLLLHWVVSSQGKTPGTKQRTPLKIPDGFDHSGLWIEGAKAQAYYLHGAVHIYEYPFNARRLKFYTEMLRYGPGNLLTTQVDARLAADNYPIFIAAGRHEEKAAMQRQRDYLRQANSRLKRALDQPDSALFTFGHSFGKSDDHIVQQIDAGAVGTICLGVHSNEDRVRAGELAKRWSDARTNAGKPAPKVYVFPATECAVWSRNIPA